MRSGCLYKPVNRLRRRFFPRNRNRRKPFLSFERFAFERFAFEGFASERPVLFLRKPSLFQTLNLKRAFFLKSLFP